MYTTTVDTMTTGATEDSWSIYYENAEKGEKRDGSQLSEVYKRTILPFRDPFGWRGVRLPFASLKARESSPNLNAEREHKCNVAMPRCRAHSIVLMAHGSWQNSHDPTATLGKRALRKSGRQNEHSKT